MCGYAGWLNVIKWELKENHLVVRVYMKCECVNNHESWPEYSVCTVVGSRTDKCFEVKVSSCADREIKTKLLRVVKQRETER